MDRYFGHTSGEWEKAQMSYAHDGSGRALEMSNAMDNPENYTTSRPNMGAKPAFEVRGISGKGQGTQPGTAYYKIEQPKAAPAPTPAPTPEPTPEPEPEIKPTGPVEYSPEITQAKERVNKYQSDIKDGITSQNIYSKDSYINRDSTLSNKYDFSAKTFGGQSDKAAASFLDQKKQQLNNKLTV